MRSCMVIVVALAVSAQLAWWGAQANAVPVTRPIVCATDDVSPQIRKVCQAYEAFSELATSAKDYLDHFAAEAHRQSVRPLPAGIKREDVGHVFLRFGKRR
ncbi:myosuppressin [Schistocerca americana]|uniref:myosuppressin n=1 Tax=Schistocerca americana TaxID=7009 RepID=UPI001F4F2D56|nr:myosuppressin [Schistocerca americana]XP_047104226.1 myosuppressin [Schistocerca piceifrons]XP_049782867.1 myosuppressin [Schistocerca cancellata]XP_049844539.1 myosuppressin isoform X1 [Schistocerca gregaria]UGX04215.1 myosuppressin transcript b [Schistocerca gregaria]